MRNNHIPEDSRQWVCLQCGYNMIGEMPEFCPFCGAGHDRFMAWGDAENTYRITPHAVNSVVTQLLSVPRLGLEHAAYRIESEAGDVWIDSPSAFNRNLAPIAAILFTHHHFLGASNQYRHIWHSEVWLHELDAKHRLVTLFDIDRRFKGDFTAYGIQGYHIGGHTPGFTFYIYQDVLFICDYVFLTADGMHFNPYGPEQETRKQAKRILQIVADKALKTVCGYNYVADFGEWITKFESLVLQV